MIRRTLAVVVLVVGMLWGLLVLRAFGAPALVGASVAALLVVRRRARSSGSVETARRVGRKAAL